MGHTQAEKAQSRERILAEAARQIRQHGLESVSIGKLMRNVGLTHGGFYNHFASRSELLEEALERALEDGARNARSNTDDEPATDLIPFVRAYLSRAHRDAPETGCAMAALLADVGRADPELRKVMEPHLRRFMARMASGTESESAEAIVAVSAMIGALGIARVLTDPGESDRVLKNVRDYVIETLRSGKGDSQAST